MENDTFALYFKMTHSNFRLQDAVCALRVAQNMNAASCCSELNSNSDVTSSAMGDTTQSLGV